MDDFKTFQTKLHSALLAVEQSINKLANEDLPFQRTVNPSVSIALDSKTSRLLGLAHDLLKSAGGRRSTNSSSVMSLQDVDDVDLRWKSIVDTIDSLLERADTCLDEYTGLIKRKDAPTVEAGRAIKKPKPTSGPLDWSLRRANMLKPQEAFERKVDNFIHGPWKPILSSKPHAKVPLEDCLQTFEDDEGNVQYKHPYETEIKEAEYPRSLFQKAEPTMYLPVETTSAVWVDTYEGVLEMLEELKQAPEIAVDLEHHDFRTYAGLLSLMQISTRQKDWIVDTLQPWRHKLEILNHVFSDPAILKVFHGAYMDIVWLQRDLGLYVVGLFDTFYACEALDFPVRSLASLLKRYVDFDADKKYQLADWRIRPLPDEMMYYARSDTHYLLYIFDMVRNAIPDHYGDKDGKNALMLWVTLKSREVALNRYEGTWADPVTGRGPRGWYTALLRGSPYWSPEQLGVFKAIFNWRDQKARRYDESPSFIMSQQMLTDIVRVMPSDPKALWSLLMTPGRSVKPYVDELFQLIQEAKAAGVNGPAMSQVLQATDNSVAATVKRVFRNQAAHHNKATTADKTTATGLVLQVNQVRSHRSQLWGDMPVSTVWEATKARQAAPLGDDVQVPLSWAHWTQGTTMTTSDVPQQASEETKSGVHPPPETDCDMTSLDVAPPTATAEGQLSYIRREVDAEEEEDDEFVLKKRGSRKRRARQRKETTIVCGVGDGQDAADASFDYVAAQAALEGAPNTAEDQVGGSRKRGKRGAERYNPFHADGAGDANAPKPARNLHAHKSGKTATFKK